MKLAKLSDNLLAWKGDAALMFVARTVLIENYPDMPIRFLQARVDQIVSNSALTRYCKRKGYAHGCNIMEIKIGKNILSDFDGMKAVVLDIIRHEKLIRRMDAAQLKDGKVCPAFLEDVRRKESLRLAKSKFFRVMDKVNMSYHNKHRVYSWVSGIFDYFFKK